MKVNFPLLCLLAISAALPCFAGPGLQRREATTLERRSEAPDVKSVDRTSTSDPATRLNPNASKPETPPDWRDEIGGDNYWPSDVVKELRHVNKVDKTQEAIDRAKLANDMINARISTFNNGTGVVTHYVPGIDGTKHRAAVDLLRGDGAPTEANGEQFVNWAWSLRTGACEEHSNIMASLLRKSTKLPVKILKSSAGHSFVVVGMAPGADPDRPWTWGKEAFVADSWLGKVMTPQEAWGEKYIFQNGAAHTFDQSVSKSPEIRKWADTFRAKGPAYVKARMKEVQARLPAELINADGTIKEIPGTDAPPKDWLK
jgi:hypothetical protein